MNSVVISLGGSLVVPNEIDTNFVAAFKSFVETHVKNGVHFVLIVGGGKTCRKYNSALEQVANPTKDALDWLGIEATRLNAHFIREALAPYTHNEIIIDPNSIPNTDKPIIVGGGWKPGWSTDYDAIIAAGKIGAKKVINLSNIDFLYDKDPKKFSDAQKIEKISWADMRKLLPEEWDPGLNAPFDPIAAREAEKLGIEVAIIGGSDLENLENYLAGKAFKGSVIS